MTLTISEGQWFDILFPDGRLLNVACSADEYDVSDQQGRLLLSVARDTGRGWDQTTVEWPIDGRFQE